MRFCTRLSSGNILLYSSLSGNEETAMAARTEIRHAEAVASVDPIWDTMQQEARAAAEADPLLAAFLYSTNLSQSSLADRVIHRNCARLPHPNIQAGLLRQTFSEMMAARHTE